MWTACGGSVWTEYSVVVTPGMAWTACTAWTEVPPVLKAVPTPFKGTVDPDTWKIGQNSGSGDQKEACSFSSWKSGGALFE